MQKNTKAKVVNGAWLPISQVTFTKNPFFPVTAGTVDTMRLQNVQAMKVTAAQINTLGTCTRTFVDRVAYYQADTTNQEEQKDTAMSNDLSNQRYHLSNRLHRVHNDKTMALSETYGLREQDQPRTGQELVDRILAGKYIVREQKKDVFGYEDDETEYTANRWIDWRDPAIKKDVKGYEAAAAKLEKEKTKVLDIIAILEPAEGLKALQAFEDYDTSRPN